MFRTFYSTSDWRNDLFFLQQWLFWTQSNFHQVAKKQQQQQQLSQNDINEHSQHTEKPPWACDKGCKERFPTLKRWSAELTQSRPICPNLINANCLYEEVELVCVGGGGGGGGDLSQLAYTQMIFKKINGISR